MGDGISMFYEPDPAPPQTSEEQRLIDTLRYKEWLPSRGQVLLVSVRGNAPLGTNSFDDRAGTVYRDHTGELYVRLYDATNDPGDHWLNNPPKPGGTAVACRGYYTGAMILGDHRGKPGLLNRGLTPITYNRYLSDGEGGWKINESNSANFIGLNIHRAGTASTQVDRWSAGCTVFARAADMDEVLNTCERALDFCKGGTLYFSYAILEHNEVHGTYSHLS
jgi:hypothetical protein